MASANAFFSILFITNNRIIRTPSGFDNFTVFGQLSAVNLNDLRIEFPDLLFSGSDISYCQGQSRTKKKKYQEDHCHDLVISILIKCEQNKKCSAYHHLPGLKQGKIFLRLDSQQANHALSRYYDSLGYSPVGTCVDGSYEGILREKALDPSTET